MASLQGTNLVITSAQLPPDFSGTPADLQRAIVERLRILSATGSTSFVQGSVEPPGDSGPWLKTDGTVGQWWVFDPNVGHYVPVDISASLTALFIVQEVTPENPTAGDAKIWVRTKSNRVLGWYFFDGSEWRPDGQTPPSGPTADRPSDPEDLETYFDTSISVLLHFERGAWRTVSGSPGDVKFVTAPKLTDALTVNPGWEYLGQNSQDFRGKVLGVATKDPGASPESSFSTASGISGRAKGDLVGEENHTLADLEIPQHTHLVGSLTHLNSENNAYFYRVDNSENFVAPGSAPPNHALILGEGASNGTKTGQLPAAGSGTMFVTSKQLSEVTAADYTDAAIPHNNLPPTVYLWALVKL